MSVDISSNTSNISVIPEADFPRQGGKVDFAPALRPSKWLEESVVSRAQLIGVRWLIVGPVESRLFLLFGDGGGLLDVVLGREGGTFLRNMGNSCFYL